MSLITCCPSCGTKFRVVADQLRISQGWVRCGRCQEVFDATQALEDVPLPSHAAEAERPALPSEARPPQEETLPGSVPDAGPTSDAPERDRLDGPDEPGSLDRSQALVASPASDGNGNGAASPAVSVPRASTDSAGYELPSPVDVQDDEDMLPPWLEQPSAPAWAEPATRSLHADGLDIEAETVPAPAVPWEPEQALPAEDAQAMLWHEPLRSAAQTPVGDVEPQLLTEEDAVEPQAPDTLETPLAPLPAEALAPEQPQTAADMPAPGVDALGAGDTPSVPSFVKKAQRKAWWSQPGVRFAIGMLVILLPLALLLQIAVHERNTLVAWKPQWRPAFETMCVALRCQIAPRQHIASVVLTGSSFRQDAQPHHYRLEMSIQNQAATAVATPAVELTLTDAQDQVLVRKVLLPADMGAPAELAARSEWNGHLPVATQGLNLPVAGYRVMAFYP